MSFDTDLHLVLQAQIDGGKKQVAKIIRKKASTLARVISEDSPERASTQGKYAKGWSVSKSDDGYDTVEYVVYNKSQAGLTHLLEHGHIMANGLRSKKIPHINDNGQKLLDEYVAELEKIDFGEGNK